MLTYKRFHGKEIEEIVEPLAGLRISVFYDFPYLYEGTLAYEQSYLQTYVNASQAMVLGVFDGGQMVGATTCLPMSHETHELTAPLLAAGHDISKIFYFGESLLLPDYRGQGIGHRFFDEREAHARQFGQYTHTCFCAVVRPDTHPLRPADYQPLHGFWHKRGYTEQPELVAHLSWLDRGDTHETTKPLTYWFKEI